jgi:hypothetical protein
MAPMTTNNPNEKKSSKSWLLIALAIPMVFLGVNTLKSLNTDSSVAVNQAPAIEQSQMMANAGDHHDDHKNHDEDHHGDHHNHDGDHDGEHGDHHLTGNNDTAYTMLNTVEEGIEGLTGDNQEKITQLMKKASDFGVNVSHPEQLETAITRGQLASWLAKYKKLALTDSTHMTSFKDVTPESPYYEDIEAVTAANLMNGYEVKGQNEFRPNQHLTREELCLVFLKWTGKANMVTESTDSLSVIPDMNTITENYRPSIATAYQTGFMKKTFGISPEEFEAGHQFEPKKEVTQLQGLQALFL